MSSTATAAPSAATSGSACPTATTVPVVRWPRPSRPTWPSALTWSRRSATPRSTPGAPWRRGFVPAWASTFRIAFSGRAKARNRRQRIMTELRGLYVVTPDDRLLARLSALVEMALEGGARIVQYRNKQAPPPLRRAQAAELLRICRAHGARLIVNDDVWLAVEIGADGAHVGRVD